MFNNPFFLVAYIVSGYNSIAVMALVVSNSSSIIDNDVCFMDTRCGPSEVF